MFTTLEKEAVFSILLALIINNENPVKTPTAQAYLNILNFTDIELLKGATKSFHHALEEVNLMTVEKKREVMRVCFEVLKLNKINSRHMNQIDTIIAKLEIEKTLENLGDIFTLLVAYKYQQSLIGR